MSGVVTGLDFNPRAPCGARPRILDNIESHMEFQSTRPVRGATGSSALGVKLVKFQSTRPVRGATLLHCLLNSLFAFQSTRPVRGATMPCSMVVFIA